MAEKKTILKWETSHTRINVCLKMMMCGIIISTDWRTATAFYCRLLFPNRTHWKRHLRRFKVTVQCAWSLIQSHTSSSNFQWKAIECTWNAEYCSSAGICVEIECYFLRARCGTANQTSNKCIKYDVLLLTGTAIHSIMHRIIIEDEKTPRLWEADTKRDHAEFFFLPNGIY